MYRAAPDNALFQGDVLVVPMPQVHVDPTVIREDGPPQMACEKCGTKKKAKRKTYRPVSQRVQRPTGDPLFEATDTEQTVGGLRSTLAVILSHSCDIDRNGTLRFAAVRPLSFLDAYQQQRVRNRDEGNFAYMLLEPYGPMPEAVIDFESQFFLSVDHFGHREKFSAAGTNRDDWALVPFVETVENRIVSLNAAALEELYVRTVRHLVRPREAKFELQISPSVFEDDANRPGREKRRQKGWWWPRPGWLSRPPALTTPSAQGEGAA